MKEGGRKLHSLLEANWANICIVNLPSFIKLETVIKDVKVILRKRLQVPLMPSQVARLCPWLETKSWRVLHFTSLENKLSGILRTRTNKHEEQ